MRLAAVLALAASPAFGAPFLYANPYPGSATQPDAASFTTNGGAPVACTLVAVSGGLQPKCDLGAITSPGTYTLVMTVTVTAGIVNSGTGAVNTQGASASSSPFSYQLRAAAVSSPVLTVAP